MERLKCSQAYMQCDLGGFNATGVQVRNYLRREVQAGGRSGERALLAGIARVVALAGCRIIGAGEVRRQRHMADFFQHLKKVRHCSKPQSPFAEFTTGNYFGFKRFAEINLLAYANFSSWPDQRLPLQLRIRRNLPGEQYFDSALQTFFRRRIARAYLLLVHSGTVPE